MPLLMATTAASTAAMQACVQLHNAVRAGVPTSSVSFSVCAALQDTLRHGGCSTAAERHAWCTCVLCPSHPCRQTHLPLVAGLLSAAWCCPAGKVGAEVVEAACIIELPALKGREKLGSTPLFVLIEKEGE